MNKSSKAAPQKQDAEGGKTKVAQDGEKAPRLPHEHDQSSDSQQTRDGHPPEVGRQAHEDVERGLVDTDRGLEANRVYKSGKISR
ncbi:MULTISPECIES: hypothetical protein [Variovorax]|jgi:hypothetical protein|uniref:hypothetical protein n=1 Tax=Variovorax TaxID=34072 RepID=UPI000869C5D1|nr:MULTISPECIES: hypothetical protein [Variovorax]MBN8755447.1 hypothetical protein [Variovorax sp.]ODU14083.1 MAG: hypothetical protein ABS94_24145 [Variovorax sp. SCN 67-85]ODV22833.1 MAG: hypothetical protein ABT25_20750 [Variovorax sp. SCN 67-20]OJZ12559.1 MAG: hypothetical protein BGP22_31800 [Variovorax sp. 67-131]UKI09297.1 hypothetical protein L3V85_05400 [Variovorax paradoxus]